MVLKKLSLKEFRNASQAEIPFGEGVNLLYGANAQGKTNAVEAVYYLAALKSFRCPKVREMIAYDAKEAWIRGEISLKNKDVELQVTLPRTGRRTVMKNGVKPEKLSEYLGVFRAVLFCPEHLRLIKDGPGERRAFLDGAICQLKPTYASLLNEFHRLSAQRAALFRAAGGNKSVLSQLEVWDSAYAEVSLRVSRMRMEYLNALKEPAARFYSLISSQQEELSFSYQCDVDPFSSDAREKFMDLLRRHRDAELKSIFAPKGAHRDDMVIRVDSRAARFYSSQGQQRSAVLSLKLAEGELSRRFTGEPPVFLLDDVLSELDAHRRSFILSNISSGQVIITSCDPSDFSSLPDLHKIRVNGGRYEV